MVATKWLIKFQHKDRPTLSYHFTGTERELATQVATIVSLPMVFLKVEKSYEQPLRRVNEG